MNRTWLRRSRVAWTAVVIWTVAVPSHSAQAGRTRVEYDVEFSTLGSLLDRNCTATGTDVLIGTLVGYEPAGRNDANEYIGTLTRFTDISICGTRRSPAGEDVVCSINIKGQGLADVELRLEAGQREGYLQYVDRASRRAWPPRPSATPRSTVTGTCDPAELAQLQTEYADGSTAGSPSGQPIEVASLPPKSYPFTFAPRPPQSIWTLTVLRRRP